MLVGQRRLLRRVGLFVVKREFFVPGLFVEAVERHREVMRASADNGAARPKGPRLSYCAMGRDFDLLRAACV